MEWPMDCNNVTLLIAEDDDGHAELIEEYLRDAGLHTPIIRFRNGQETWNFLTGADSDPKLENQTEYLLLLDIKMPRMDGIEVLRRMKNDSHLKTIPVVMLTTTDDPREIDACYRLGCSFCITKPVDCLRFSETMRRLGLFVMAVRLAPVELSL